MKAENIRELIHSPLYRFKSIDWNEMKPRVAGELEELERIATEYETNKRYIELGKVVEKSFKDGKELFCGTVYETCGYAELTSYNRIDSINDLLEWAEGEEE